MKYKLLAVVILLLVAFLAGFWTQHPKVQRLQAELSSTQQEAASTKARLQFAQLRDSGAMLYLQASLNRFDLAQEYSTRFFDQATQLAYQTTDAELKKRLESILTLRDKVTAGLATKDPGVVANLQSLLIDTQGLGSPAGQGAGSQPGPSRADRLQNYLAAWKKGDVDLILGTLADNFVLHDPEYGTISKAEYRQYFANLRKAIQAAGGNQPNQAFRESTDVVTREEGDSLIAWVHWSFPGTEIEGASLSRIGAGGIVSQQVFYKTPLKKP
jgi:SnoaL-like domain